MKQNFKKESLSVRYKIILFLLVLNFFTTQLSAQNNTLDFESTTDFEAIILGENIQISCDNVIELFAQEVENVSYYKWYLNDQPFDEGRNLITTIAGRYKLLVRKGNCDAVSEEVIVMLNKKPLAKIAQLNKTHFWDNGILNADLTSPNATYQWILNDKILGEETSISVSESGIYTLQVTQNDCQVSTEIEVFVSSTPLLPFSFLEDIFKIYPNPSTGIFKVHFGSVLSEDTQVSIFDVTGKVIRKQVFKRNNQDFVIDLQKFAKGMYLIYFKQNNSIYSKSVLTE
jgi:hypothetical protein